MDLSAISHIRITDAATTLHKHATHDLDLPMTKMKLVTKQHVGEGDMVIGTAKRKGTRSLYFVEKDSPLAEHCDSSRLVIPSGPYSNLDEECYLFESFDIPSEEDSAHLITTHALEEEYETNIVLVTADDEDEESLTFWKTDVLSLDDGLYDVSVKDKVDHHTIDTTTELRFADLTGKKEVEYSVLLKCDSDDPEAFELSDMLVNFPIPFSHGKMSVCFSPSDHDPNTVWNLGAKRVVHKVQHVFLTKHSGGVQKGHAKKPASKRDDASSSTKSKKTQSSKADSKSSSQKKRSAPSSSTSEDPPSKQQRSEMVLEEIGEAGFPQTAPQMYEDLDEEYEKEEEEVIEAN